MNIINNNILNHTMVCSICKKEGHNSNNKKFHPVKEPLNNVLPQIDSLEYICTLCKKKFGSYTMDSWYEKQLGGWECTTLCKTLTYICENCISHVENELGLITCPTCNNPDTENYEDTTNLCIKCNKDYGLYYNVVDGIVIIVIKNIHLYVMNALMKKKKK